MRGAERKSTEMYTEYIDRDFLRRNEAVAQYFNAWTIVVPCAPF